MDVNKTVIILGRLKGLIKERDEAYSVDCMHTEKQDGKICGYLQCLRDMGLSENKVHKLYLEADKELKLIRGIKDE